MAKTFFLPILRKLEAILAFDIDELALELAQTQQFKTLVIKLNTEGLPTSQLFILGEDSTGKKLDLIGGEYSPFTVEEKKKKGQPTDRITLKDTGDFYATFKVIPFKGGFRIEANTIKDGDDLEKDWGNEIIGLNDGNLKIIIDLYKEFILDKVKTAINAA